MSNLPTASILWTQARKPNAHKAQKLLHLTLKNEALLDISVLLAAAALASHPSSHTSPRLTTALHRTLHSHLSQTPNLQAVLNALTPASHLPQPSLNAITKALITILPSQTSAIPAFNLAALSARVVIHTNLPLLRTSIANALPPHPHDGALALCAGFLTISPTATDPLFRTAQQRALAVAATPHPPVPLRADTLATALLPRVILDQLPPGTALTLANAIAPPVLADTAGKLCAPALGRSYGELTTRATRQKEALSTLRDTATAPDRPTTAYITAALPPLASNPTLAVIALDIFANLPHRPIRTRRALSAVASKHPDACAALIARAADASTSKIPFAMLVAADVLEAPAVANVSSDAWTRFANAVVSAAGTATSSHAAIRAGAALIHAQYPEAGLRAALAVRLLRAIPPRDVEGARRLAVVVDAAVRGSLPPVAVGAVVRALGDAVRGAENTMSRALCFGLQMRCLTTCALDVLRCALREAGHTLKGLDETVRDELAPIAKLAVIGSDAARKAELVRWLLEQPRSRM